MTKYYFLLMFVIFTSLSAMGNPGTDLPTYASNLPVPAKIAQNWNKALSNTSHNCVTATVQQIISKFTTSEFIQSTSFHTTSTGRRYRNSASYDANLPQFDGDISETSSDWVEDYVADVIVKDKYGKLIPYRIDLYVIVFRVSPGQIGCFSSPSYVINAFTQH